MEISLNFKKEAVFKILEVPTRSQIGSFSKMYAVQFTGVQKFRSDISIAALPVRVHKLYARRGKLGVNKTYVAQIEGGTLRLTARAVRTTVTERVPVSEEKPKRK